MNFSQEQSEYFYHKVFPSVNNEDLLEFRIPPNFKNQLHLENTVLHFSVEIPAIKEGLDILPQNFLGPKQFSSLEIRINGDPVTRRSCSNEYFLAAYFQYVLPASRHCLCTQPRSRSGLFWGQVHSL